MVGLSAVSTTGSLAHAEVMECDDIRLVLRCYFNRALLNLIPMEVAHSLTPRLTYSTRAYHRSPRSIVGAPGTAKASVMPGFLFHMRFTSIDLGAVV